MSSPELWTWRAIDADGEVKLSSAGEFSSFSSAMRNAKQFGFEEGRDEWYIGSPPEEPCRARRAKRRAASGSTSTK
jgi:hypothetical protein